MIKWYKYTVKHFKTFCITVFVCTLPVSSALDLLQLPVSLSLSQQLLPPAGLGGHQDPNEAAGDVDTQSLRGCE